ncbi:MAG: hypothetical protein N2D54_07515, partial [Chloroflexota bacterium]
MKKERSFIRTLGIGVAILIGIVVYAYGFTITDVDFAETVKENRRAVLTRILRALAKPDLVEYDQEEQIVEFPYYLPCPEGGLPFTTEDRSGPFVTIDPPCAGPKEIIQIKGFNMWPKEGGSINFLTQSGASLPIGFFSTDDTGYFEIRTELPNRQPVAEAQPIKVLNNRNIGSPRWTDTSQNTWTRIIETIFIALLATTFGTLLALPISFLAARNLMSDVKQPATGMALEIIGWPIGILLGIKLLDILNDQVLLSVSGNMTNLLAVVLTPITAVL